MTTAVLEAPQATTKKGSAAACSMATSSLQDALSKLAPVLSGKTTIPVLKSIKVEPTDGAVFLTASDLDRSVRVKVAAKASPGDSYLIPSERFINFANRLPGGESSLSVAGSRVKLRSGVVNAQFPQNSASNFPVVEFGVVDGPQAPITLKQSAFRDLLRHTSFAMSMEESRYTLKGALLVREGHSVGMVATDGHRLAKCLVPLEGGKFEDFLIPGEMIAALNKVVADSDKEITIGEGGPERIGFEVAGDSPMSLSSRKLIGQFPNYRAVVPQGEMEVELRVSVDAALDAIERCLTVADENSHCVKLSISPESITFYAVDAQAGESFEELKVESTGPTFKNFAVGFSGEYLADALKHLDGDCVFAFSKADGTVALRITADLEDGGSFLYVVMPMWI